MKSAKPRSIVIGGLLLFVAAAIVVWFSVVCSAPANGAVGSLPKIFMVVTFSFPATLDQPSMGG